MLAPDTRVVLSDALRPPPGFQVDVAVGTTYSLDLTALLLAPMSFAMVEATDGVDRSDPSSLLAAVRRYCERTTVFCQAGAIAVPSAYRSVLTFLEDSVQEVVAPNEGRVFHPKVWALRFIAPDGATTHRLVCLSRNLTFDRSWDTVLVLDDEDDAAATVDAAPLVRFLGALPGMAVRPIPDDRLAQVDSLASSFAMARLTAPAPFDDAVLLPLGAGEGEWPLPPSADRVLVVSPFLGVTALRRAASMSSERIVVSRPETFTRLGAGALAGWQTRTLTRFAEDSADAVEPTAAEDAENGHDAPWGQVPDGLHAKVVVADVGDRGHLVTGSANLTSAAWGGNVEFCVVLSGPVRTCGVAATLGVAEGADGLAQLLEDYVVENVDGVVDPQEVTALELERFHQRLAAGIVLVEVRASETDDAFALTVALEVPGDTPGDTEIWPITLKRDAHARALAPSLTWSEVSLGAVTPFIAVETTAGTGSARVTRRCVLRGQLIGDVPGRLQLVLRDILDRTEDVLRYLALLLADPTLGPASVMTGLGALAHPGHGVGEAVAVHDVVLFEPLVRAAVRDRAAVERVAVMVEELRGGPKSLLPEGFDELWAVVREVVMAEEQP